MTSKNKKTYVNIITGLLAAVLVLCCLSACEKGGKNINTQSFPKDDIADVYPSNTNTNLHVSEAGNSNLKLVAKSGLVEIYLDTTTYAVAVRETLKDAYWYSLPVVPGEYTGRYNFSASPINITLVNGAKTYYLNSQDNAVAQGNAYYNILYDNVDKPVDTNSTPVGVQVYYFITPDIETAEKKAYSETDIVFLVSLTYTLQNGSLYVNCEHINLTGNPNVFMKDISLLEYFGASASAQPGDFLLVPDKGGALIHTAVEQPSFSPMTLQVYGGNQSTQTPEDEKAAVVAAFGMKKGENALAVIVEEGDAVARISADRATGSSGFNKVGASFTITEMQDVEKGNKIIRTAAQNSFNGSVKLCLRFLSGGNATYSGIAAVCREQLIRDNILSKKTLESTENLPFHLTTVGAVKTSIIDLIPVKSTKNLTAFDQTQDMVSRMKSKGVNNISLRYTGALTGGLNQEDISKASILRTLGGKTGFEELNTYMNSQKMDLYLDIGLLSFKQAPVFDKAKTITTVSRGKGYTLTKNDISAYSGNTSFKQNLRPVAGLDNAVLKVLSGFRNSSLGGFCLNDAGRILYSDFSGIGYNRQDTAEEIDKQIAALSNGREIMLDTGNFSAVKNAGVIVNMPMPPETGEGENIPYQYIPFIQLILHGIVDYSGTPINLSFNPGDSTIQSKDLLFASLTGQKQKPMKDMMLKYIEYGACPSYIWSYKRLDDPPKVIETFYYDDWINQAVDFYAQANAALSDLRSLRMVRHTQILPGVFRTEYEGSKLIYVNYNNTDVDVGGITVKARDFLRL